MSDDTGAATPSRRSAASTSTGERILEVAEALIAQHGMEGLRLKDVAERVGIQPPSVFAHFEGREAIGDAVAQRVLAQIAQVLDDALSAPGGAEERLRAGCRAVAEHLFDHPGHTRLILRDLARTRSGTELELWSPDMERIGARVEAFLAEGREANLFRELPMRATLPMIEGAIVALIGWEGFREDARPAGRLSREEIAVRVEDLAWAWVRAR